MVSVRNVDFCIEKNSINHHTENFFKTTPNLVVRRGQPFQLIIEFDRKFDFTNDAITFIFTVYGEDRPSSGNSTLIVLAPSDKIIDDHWTISKNNANASKVEFTVNTSANTSVSSWKIEIDTKTMLTGAAKSYKCSDPIYILFNPWCEKDLVYLSDESKCREYVLEDTTLIFKGSQNEISSILWKLGQFDADILQCSLYLITKIGKINASSRGNVINVARVLSAVVNARDDNGVLVGNWSSDYSNGQPPTSWIGSTKILQNYYKTKKPIKFGQCWVFAGVLTTIARSLGIPSRIITNFSSAHDSEGSMTIDVIVNNETLSKDSVWNFHVWNEVWMQRPDLGVGTNGNYSGWQAIDSTPQELSNGMYRCGPAPVKAIKYGEVFHPYDTQFLFSEINADRLYWMHNGPDKPMKLLNKDTTSIGQFISTKAVGKWEREDVTLEYKFQENSDKERNTMYTALRQSDHLFSRYYLNEIFNEVEFKVDVRDDITIGEKIILNLNIINKSDEKVHRALGRLSAESVLYTGKQRIHVKSKPFEIDIKPGSSEKVFLEVEFNDYFKKLLPQSAFKIVCIAKVVNTDFDYFSLNDFRVNKPVIKIYFNEKVSANKPVEVTLMMENPLPVKIHKGEFTVGGGTLRDDIRLKVNFRK